MFMKFIDQLVSVYVINRQNVVKCCREFKVGRSDVHDEERNGRRDRDTIPAVPARGGGRTRFGRIWRHNIKSVCTFNVLISGKGERN